MLHPPAPQSVDELEEQLSRPPASLVDLMRRLPGDLLILGVGGKMGPTLARMARRATDAAAVSRRVIGGSRFSTGDLPARLAEHGIDTIACDLLDEQTVRALPDAENIIAMPGFKFGASDAAARTWAVNCLVPVHVCRRFPASRIVAFSTGNVYGMVDMANGGSRESDPLRPDGEYAMAAVGRERMYQYFSEVAGTPMAILRLNYATELRYGVLVDIGLAVLADQAVDLSTAWVNVIWQADANAMALRALEHAGSPAHVLNVAGSEILRIRDVAERFAKLWGRSVRFVGEESPLALLSDGHAAYAALGQPSMAADSLIRWTADWLARGGETLNKPTMFQVRDGKF